MRFGLIYELQLPRPWDAESEHRMVQDALAEVEVADHLGFDCVWANEHHFLEEYSHNSAPEVFLAAAAARTKQIHPGHAVVLSPLPTTRPRASQNGLRCSTSSPQVAANGVPDRPPRAPNWKASTSTRHRRS